MVTISVGLKMKHYRPEKRVWANGVDPVEMALIMIYTVRLLILLLSQSQLLFFRICLTQKIRGERVLKTPLLTDKIKYPRMHDLLNTCHNNFR